MPTFRTAGELYASMRRDLVREARRLKARGQTGEEFARACLDDWVAGSRRDIARGEKPRVIRWTMEMCGRALIDVCRAEFGVDCSALVSEQTAEWCGRSLS